VDRLDGMMERGAHLGRIGPMEGVVITFPIRSVQWFAGGLGAAKLLSDGKLPDTTVLIAAARNASERTAGSLPRGRAAKGKHDSALFIFFPSC